MDEQSAPVSAVSSGASTIGRRRTVLDWRDYWLAEVELKLRRDLRTLVQDLEAAEGVRRPWYVRTEDPLYEQEARGAVELWLQEIKAEFVEAPVRELRLVLTRETFGEPPARQEGAAEFDISGTSAAGALREGACGRDWRQRVTACVLGGADATSLKQELDDHLRHLAAAVLARP